MVFLLYMVFSNDYISSVIVVFVSKVVIVSILLIIHVVFMLTHSLLVKQTPSAASWTWKHSLFPFQRMVRNDNVISPSGDSINKTMTMLNRSQT